MAKNDLAAAGAPGANETAGAEAPPRHRPTRKPFGSMDQKLAWPPIKGHHLHWFNDIPGRLDRAKEAGYEHVKDADGKTVSRIVGSASEGGGLRAYLMKIPQEWYDEDMKLEQKRIDELDGDLRRGRVAGEGLNQKHDGAEKFYVGKQGIVISSGAGRTRV